MKTECSEMWGDFCRRMRFVVICEFHNGKPFMPIVMQGIDVEAKINLEFLIDTFSLTIGLRMIGCRGSTFDAASFIKASDEIINELGTSVTGDGMGKAIVTNPMSD
jgi:hypothetical protein